MHTTWIVAADSTRARILEKRGKDEPLRELEDLYNPEGRQNNNEIVSDSRGRFWGRQGRPWGQGDSGEPQTTPVEHEVTLFARELAQYLDKGRNDHLYERLFIIADPKFLGILRTKMNKHVSEMVEQDAAYEISNWNTHQIAEFAGQKFGLH